MGPRVNGLVDLVEVGRGGFGTVYRATDERFGRRVAVKVIRDAGLGKDVVARFERECLALGSLSGHPNIVSVHDSGTTEEGDLYLVMEYLGGGSLSQRLASRGAASPQEVAMWGAALAGALETAHRSGIVHRDVKPENALFSDYGDLKLVDFGIARMRSAYETRSGFISATLSHAAPEIVAGAPITPAADVYSLASVLFTMLYGRAPFDRGQEDSLAPLIARIASAAPPDLREVGVPAPLAATLERGLTKTVGERFESAAEFGFALQAATRAMGGAEVAVPVGNADDVAEAAAVVHGGPDTPPDLVVDPGGTAHVARRRAQGPVTPPVEPVRKGSRRRRVLAVAAAAAVLLGGGGAYVAWGLAGETIDPPAAGNDAVAPSTRAIQVKDDNVQASGVRIARTYAIKGGDRVGSTVELRNVTKKPVTRVWPEVIPKQLALDVSDITFSRQPTEIVDRDPIVLWKLTIKPGATRTISWTTDLPAETEPSRKFLDRAIRWHRKAVASSRTVVNAALESAADSGKGSAILAGETMDGQLPAPVEDFGDGFAPGTPSDPGSNADPGPQAPDQPQPQPQPQPKPQPKPQPQPQPNRSPVISVSNRSSDELSSVSFSLGVSDPDGDRVSVSVSGLPAGVGSGGASISGRISHDAASVTTDRRNGIRSRTFTVTVSAQDSRGGNARRSFSWTVRDTHRTMPNYIGKEGCGGCQGLPDVAAISSPGFLEGCDPNGDGNRIVRQSVGPGAVIRWGQGVTYWYGYARAC